MKSGAAAAFALAALCVLAYAPSTGIPLIEDDYPNLVEAQHYGSPADFPALLASPIARMRATSYWTMYPLFRRFRLWAPGYHWFSLFLHVLNVWLVYAIGLAWRPMRAAAPWAAGFFAIHEGHQEAVMWFSAINELWMFFFGAAALLCWLEARRRRRPLLDLCGLALFGLALISKESAVIWLPLLLLTVPRRTWLAALPYTGLAAVAAASIFLSRSNSFRFSDGSFSLHAPFWLTWPRGIARLVWFWGVPAAAVVWFSRDVQMRRSALRAAAWMAAALVPYTFLTYSTAIPSRQTYLAGAGLAWLVGLALAYAWQHHRRWAAAAVVLILLHNLDVLWIRKRAQFLARSAPTEQLLAVARRTPGPIWVRCFPRNDYIAREALHLGAGRDPSLDIFTEAQARERQPAAVFCYQSK